MSSGSENANPAYELFLLTHLTLFIVVSRNFWDQKKNTLRQGILYSVGQCHGHNGEGFLHFVTSQGGKTQR